MVLDELIRASSEINVLLFSGFNESTHVACCGGGGPFNFNVSKMCSAPGSNVCKDPSAYIFWDGVHLTEAAYRHIAKGLLNGPFTSPRLVA